MIIPNPPNLTTVYIMKYISVGEYLMGRIEYKDLSDEQVANLNTLIPRVNELLSRFGEYRSCNSGFRTIEDQKRINPKSMKSNHLKAAAIDLEDNNRKLQKWITKNAHVLEEIGLYCEAFAHTPTWVHCQIVSPKSNKRFFTP